MSDDKTNAGCEPGAAGAPSLVMTGGAASPTLAVMQLFDTGPNVPGASVPPGWLKADGALLPTEESAEYMELFNLIGTTFGGDEDNSALPDLRGRMIAGAAPAG